jgi:hypothetical protein
VRICKLYCHSNGELHKLLSSPSIVKVMKLAGKECAGYVSGSKGRRNASGLEAFP